MVTFRESLLLVGNCIRNIESQDKYRYFLQNRRRIGL